MTFNSKETEGKQATECLLVSRLFCYCPDCSERMCNILSAHLTDYAQHAHFLLYTVLSNYESCL